MLLCLALAHADTGDTALDDVPVADAGLGLLAYVGDVVVLNGAASSDPEGASLSFVWTQTGGPEVTIKKGTTAEPEVTIDAPGTLRFSLVVNDGVQDSAPDSVEIVVAEQRFDGEAETGCAVGPDAGLAAVLLAVAVLGIRRHSR